MLWVSRAQPQGGGLLAHLASWGLPEMGGADWGDEETPGWRVSPLGLTAPPGVRGLSLT